MKREERKELFEEHLQLLAKAAQKQCSGEELKAITEAMIMVEETISSM